jgi:hypothetical protein
MTNQDARFPYTYAADYVRGLAGCGKNGMTMSRSEASQIRSGIALALGMDDAELACRLAEYYQANEAEINKAQVTAILAGLKSRGS